jgi:ribosomal protein S11
MTEQRGIVHIYATHNNTMLLLTDMTGSETIAKSTGGMETKAQHKESSPYVAMNKQKILQTLQEKKILGNLCKSKRTRWKQKSFSRNWSRSCY